MKSGLSKFCGRRPLKNLKRHGLLKQTIPSNFLKAVVPKIYLVHPWILCPKCLISFYRRISNMKVWKNESPPLFSKSLYSKIPSFIKISIYQNIKNSTVDFVPVLFLFRFKPLRNVKFQIQKIIQYRSFCNGS